MFAFFRRAYTFHIPHNWRFSKCCGYTFDTLSLSYFPGKRIDRTLDYQRLHIINFPLFRSAVSVWVDWPWNPQSSCQKQWSCCCSNTVLSFWQHWSKARIRKVNYRFYQDDQAPSFYTPYHWQNNLNYQYLPIKSAWSKCSYTNCSNGMKCWYAGRLSPDTKSSPLHTFHWCCILLGNSFPHKSASKYGSRYTKYKTRHWYRYQNTILYRSTNLPHAKPIMIQFSKSPPAIANPPETHLFRICNGRRGFWKLSQNGFGRW